MKKLLAVLLATSMLMATLAGCAAPAGSASGSASTPAPSVSTPASSSVAPEVTVPEMMEGDTFGNGAVGSNGGVSSVNAISSQVGIDILKAGGNAVDAAVATAFATGVVEPNMSGVGGAGIMTIYLKATDEFVVVEYLEAVPMLQEAGMYNSETDKYTAKNATVPAQVHGLLTALEKYGTMDRKEIMAPAIELARDGFVMTPRLISNVNDKFDLFSTQPHIADIYTNGGLPWFEGDTFKNEPLAAVLQAVSDGGIEEFYKGTTAQTIVDGLNEAGSLISMEDMAMYESVIREPITTTYYGYTIISPPPQSNGGDMLLEHLNLMEEVDIASMDHNSPEYLLAFNEANRLSIMDSYAALGDPAFFNTMDAVNMMISKEYAVDRAKEIGTDAIIAGVPASGPLPVTTSTIDPNAPESAHTTHASVIDSYGNIVSTSNTNGLEWGCSFMAPGTGFFFNSHMGNMNHEDPTNPDFVMGGKRVRSTMSPTIVLDSDNAPVLAIGSPGGLVIPPAIAAVINNVLLFDMNIQEAINAPRALATGRSSGTTERLQIEDGRFPAETVAAMEAYGYDLSLQGEYNSVMGGVAAIYLDNEAGVFYAGADPRREYQALAY